MKSKLFHSEEHHRIERDILDLINSQPDFLGQRTAASTRATGDAIQEILAESFSSLLEAICKECSTDFARRAMADLALKDQDDFYYVVDVKTHRREQGFHMPNLTAVERLARFYEDDMNYFVVLMLSYSIVGTAVTAERAHFVPIEFLSWRCLTVGALGWGQIQIANADRVEILPDRSRREWMLQLCDTLLEFYPREIGKINRRMANFREVRRFWESKAES